MKPFRRVFAIGPANEHTGTMAGRPKTRARRAAAAAAVQGVPLGAGQRAPAHDAPARARVRAHAYEYQGQSQAAVQPGAATRAVVDELAAGGLAELAAALQPGTTVRIERTRPSWCSGWVEELDLEAAGLGELYEYLTDEWGGQAYRITALYADGRPLFTSQLKVAGPPKDQGRVINRRQWEASMRGEDPHAIPHTVPAPGAPGQAQPSDMIQFLGLFLGEQRQSRDHIFEAVKTMNETHGKNVTDLMTALATKAEGTSLTAQIGDLTKGMAAVEDLKNTVAEMSPETAEEPLSNTQHWVREAGSAFARKFVEDQVNTQGRPARPTPNNTRGGPPRPPPSSSNGATPRGIPGARPVGPRQQPN